MSIERRLMLLVGLGATLFWLVAAGLTAERISREIRSLFDQDLQATAERILPLAGREVKWHGAKDDDDGRVPRYRDGDHDRELKAQLVWQVTDAEGKVVLHSEGSEAAVFPAPVAGFTDTATHRIYAASGGGLTISVAAPLTGRAALLEALLGRMLPPLALLLPLSLAGIAWGLRRGLAPLRSLSAGVAARGVQDLSPLPAAALPAELQPIAAALNGLLARLSAAFEAERAFAAQAAHELRTPVAGAIAQVQRLRAEVPAAGPRSAEIEAGLKRLMRTSEKLMQLARAEGGRVTGAPADLRPVLALMVEDASRLGAEVALTLPETPVLSVIEADAFGIVLRNLLENARNHGRGPISVTLGADLTMTLANGGPVLTAAELDRLCQRFEKGEDSQGMGLGLAIVRTIADRAGARLSFSAPPGGGLEVALRLPS